MSLRALVLRGILGAGLALPIVAASGFASISNQPVSGPPSVRAVTPRGGDAGGGNTVTVFGTGFVTGLTSVDFGANPASGVTVLSATKLTAVAPAGAVGMVDVTVATPDGTSATSAADQYVYGPPGVTAVTPNTGPPAGGNTVTISGSGFVPGARVQFGSGHISPSVTYLSGTELQAVAPAGSAGHAHVRVSTAGGTSAVTSGNLYVYADPLTVAPTGSLLSGTVSLHATSGFRAQSGDATVDFEYSLSGQGNWQPACEAVSDTASFSCSWSTASVPDGVYDLRAASQTFGTSEPLSAITVSNAVPTPTIGGVKDGESVEGRVTLGSDPIPKGDVAGISTNLVPDWSMEAVDERGMVVGWKAIGTNGTAAQLKPTDDFKPTTAGTTKLFAKSISPGGEVWAWSFSRRIPVRSRQIYDASVLMQLTNLHRGSYGTVVVDWFDAAGNQISEQQGTKLKDEGVGTATLTATSPRGAAFASVSPALFNTGPGTYKKVGLNFTEPRFEQQGGPPPVDPNVIVQYHDHGLSGDWVNLGDGCSSTDSHSYQCAVALDGLPDGAVDLRIAALDNAGNLGYSAVVTVNVSHPSIGFTQPSYTVHENQGALSVTITRTDASTDEWFYYGLRALDAQAGVDLAALPLTPVRMSAGQSSYTFRVPITDRGMNGPPVHAELSLSDSYPERITTPRAPITILRDDPLQHRARSNPLELRDGERDPLHGADFYLPGSLSGGQVEQQVDLSDSRAAGAFARIVSRPLTQVFSPTPGQDIGSTVAAYLEQASVSQPGTVPLLAARYFASACSRNADTRAERSAYANWIRGLAYGIGNFRTVLFLEPGAASGARCMSAAAVSVRAAEIAGAVKSLERDPHVVVYVDGGGAGTGSVPSIARFLHRAGAGRAQGFFLNAFRYDWTTRELAFGQQLSSRLGGKHFVIDTSQNGRGPGRAAARCQQRGRGLGVVSTQTGYAEADGLLWISEPGFSDGTCKNAPPAGTLWPSYLVSLVTHAAHKPTGPRQRVRTDGTRFRLYSSRR